MGPSPRRLLSFPLVRWIIKEGKYESQLMHPENYKEKKGKMRGNSSNQIKRED
jgi:hypothetical protein